MVDLAIVREHDVALAGPPADETVAPIPRAYLLDALLESLAWHAAPELQLHSTVLNAGRAWRYAEEGVWSSKDDAASWVLARAGDPSLVEGALAVQHGAGSRALDSGRVQEFVQEVHARSSWRPGRPNERKDQDATGLRLDIGIRRLVSLHRTTVAIGSSHGALANPAADRTNAA